MNDKISIILPVYNVEPYVGKCLESVLAQTHENLEVICVDDGSTDRSGQICREFAERDSRVVVLHKENGGLSSARNAALKTFTGDYVSFIDSDDWIEPDMYELLLGALKKCSEVDFSAGGYFMDYPDGRSIPARNAVEIKAQAISPSDYLYYAYQRDLYRGVAGFGCGKLFKRKFFDSPLNLRFDEAYPVGEDVYPLAFCALHSKKIFYTPKPLYHYYQRETSLSHDIRKSLSFSDADAYELVVESLEGKPEYRIACAYAKRFLVYHASLIMEHTISVRNKEKTAELREKIHRYLDVYLETNAEYPDRIQRIHQLLTEADRLLNE